MTKSSQIQTLKQLVADFGVFEVSVFSSTYHFIYKQKSDIKLLQKTITYVWRCGEICPIWHKKNCVFLPAQLLEILYLIRNILYLTKMTEIFFIYVLKNVNGTSKKI